MGYMLSRMAAGNNLPYGSWLVPMMGYGSGGSIDCPAIGKLVNSPLLNIALFFYLLTWFLVLLALVALIRYLWRKGGH